MKRHFILIVLFFVNSKLFSQCDVSTPLFNVDFSSTLDTLWISPDTIRSGLCCGSSNPDKCVSFLVTLPSNASGIIFNIYSGAIPPGALFYQIDCGTPTQVGQPLCLNGSGPFLITFCKPGNNQNQYSILPIPNADAGPDIAVNDGCIGQIYASGYETSTLTWTSVFPGSPGDYNHYLSCNTACDTTTVTAQIGYPTYVDYQVCGQALGACNNITICDTVRTYFNSSLRADILPVNPMVCFGDPGTYIHANPSGGTPPYDFQWSTLETSDSIFVNAGTYYLTLSDTSGCPPTFDTVQVGSYTQTLLADAGHDTTICASNTSIGLSGTLTAAPSGLWIGQGTFTNANDLNTSYFPSQAEIQTGSSVVYLQTAGHSTCPIHTDSVEVFYENFDAQINAIVDSISCHNANDANIFLQTSGNNAPFSYVWSNGQTGQINSTLSPGTYTATITDAIGCIDSSTFAIENPPLLNLNVIDRNDISCNGGSNGNIELQIDGGRPSYTISWNNGENTSSIGNLMAGNYSVTVSDQFICTDSIQVTLTEPLQALSIQNTVQHLSCFESNDGAITMQASGGTAPYSYSWNNGLNSSTINQLTANSYVLTTTDANYCIEIDTILITQPDSISYTVSLNLDTICEGMQVEATVSNIQGGTPAYQYFWDNQSGTNIHSFVAQQSNLVSFYLTDLNGCRSFESLLPVDMISTVLDSIQIISVDSVCEGETIDIEGELFSNQNQQYNFFWSTGHNWLSNFPLLVDQDTTIELIGINSCNDTIKAQKHITVNPYPDLSFVDYQNEGCAPYLFTFQGSLDSSINYTWYFSNLDSVNTLNAHYLFPNPGIYPINLKAVSSFGCITYANFIDSITVRTNPMVLCSANVYEQPVDEPIFNFSASGAMSYEWSASFLTDSSLIQSQTFQFTFEDTGKYNLALTGIDEFGCIDSCHLQVEVTPTHSIKTPNVFIPSGPSGGYISDYTNINNTIFFPFVEYVAEFEMVIFNRWGEMVFQSFDHFIGWDGYYKGKLSQQDTYMYKIIVVFTDGYKRVKTGDVTLLR